MHSYIHVPVSKHMTECVVYYILIHVNTGKSSCVPSLLLSNERKMFVWQWQFVQVHTICYSNAKIFG